MTKILTSIEFGKLPDTQPYVEAEKERLRLIKQNQQYDKELKELKIKVKKLTTAIHANQYLIRGEELPPQFRNEYVDGHPVVADTKKKFIMSCPLDCRGFLSTQYKCGTCQKSVCSDCLTLKEDNHECVEANRLTAELIKKESKPCPKCGARICKIDGCDQMYCVAQNDGVHCNTAFSWRTGVIETGVIHNPHYYALMKKEGVQLRNAGDVQCGGVPDIRRIVRAIDFLRRITDFDQRFELLPFRNDLLRIHRRICEQVQYATTEFRQRLHAHDRNMRTLRVRYMMKSLSKELFSESVYKTEREHEKNVDIHHILELISISGIETFHKIVREFPNITDYEWMEYSQRPEIIVEVIQNVKSQLNELGRVREYCNDQLKEISITHHCTVYTLDESFSQVACKFTMNGQMTKHKTREDVHGM
jgi:DNA-directed RNA polymerase subunit RPC12/RpoP